MIRSPCFSESLYIKRLVNKSLNRLMSIFYFSQIGHWNIDLGFGLTASRNPSMQEVIKKRVRKMKAADKTVAFAVGSCARERRYSLLLTRGFQSFLVISSVFSDWKSHLSSWSELVSKRESTNSLCSLRVSLAIMTNNWLTWNSLSLIYTFCSPDKLTCTF